MRNLFYAAFIPGLKDFIADVLKERLSDVNIHKLLDGAVIFETEITYDKLNFFCFNNIFAVINIREDSKENPAKTRRRGEEEGRGFFIIENHIKYFLYYNDESNKKNSYNSAFNYEIIRNNNRKFNTFRIVISNENVPASVNEKLRVEAEKTISHLSGLSVNRSLPDTEFWFLYRNEKGKQGDSFSVFMKRLTLRASWEKTLHKGELPPPLAWTLCRMAALSRGDAVLDPFCGYGSIPDAAAKHFHITDITVCDSSKESLNSAFVKFNKRKGCNFKVHNIDYCRLPSVIENNSIDAVVTDPPWGIYKKTENDYRKDFLFAEMFDVFYALLKNGGRAVVLYINDEKFFNAALIKFNIQKSVPILLSGKKAVIYVLIKK